MRTLQDQTLEDTWKPLDETVGKSTAVHEMSTAKELRLDIDDEF